MFERLRGRVVAAAARARRIERREMRTLRRRLEETSTLLHLSIVLLVPPTFERLRGLETDVAIVDRS